MNMNPKVPIHMIMAAKMKKVHIIPTDAYSKEPTIGPTA